MLLLAHCPVPGWKIEGQIERGENGTEHAQVMLLTPQVRFAAVKKVYPRAHIEVARSKKALEKYVHKADTRVNAIEVTSIPSIFEYQSIVAKKWKEDDYESWIKSFPRKDTDEVAMLYLDSLVSQDIAAGQRGAEWIASNPMWRTSWKKFWRSIIKRDGPCASNGEEPLCPALAGSRRASTIQPPVEVPSGWIQSAGSVAEGEV